LTVFVLHDKFLCKFFVGLHGDKTYNTIVCGNTKFCFVLKACRRADRVVDRKFPNTNTYATHVMANILDLHVPHSIPSQSSTMREIQNMSTTPQNQNEVKDQPLPTPISIQHLKTTLSDHPDQNLVSQLCNNFKFGVHIGFQGRWAPRFSRNLPTAFANPDTVSSNLATEVSLGRIAGLFDSPRSWDVERVYFQLE
jgi:hypothetical protein